eukprot:PhM_4_TR13069/c0_g2_i1/m.63596
MSRPSHPTVHYPTHFRSRTERLRAAMEASFAFQPRHYYDATTAPTTTRTPLSLPAGTTSPQKDVEEEETVTATSSPQPPAPPPPPPPPRTSEITAAAWDLGVDVEWVRPGDTAEADARLMCHENDYYHHQSTLNQQQQQQQQFRIPYKTASGVVGFVSIE